MSKQELTKREIAGRRNFAKMIIASQIAHNKRILEDNKNYDILYHKEKRFFEKQIFNLGLLLDTWNRTVPIGEIPEKKEDII